jgi:hypothetical protein
VGPLYADEAAEATVVTPEQRRLAEINLVAALKEALLDRGID